MTEQPTDRAEQAARDWFTAEADAGFVPIDPGAVRRSATVRRRWRGGGLAAAAALLAAVVLVPLALRGPTAPVQATPEPTGLVWQETSPAPISARWGSLTTWADGRFYLIGGWDGGPCPPNSICDMAGPKLADGARYDPATDHWTTITPAPVPVGRGFSSITAVGEQLYVASTTEDGRLWAYDEAGDQWRELATPPSFGSLVGTASRLVALTYEGTPPGYTYDPGTDTWTPIAASPLDSCDGRVGWPAGERVIVLAQCGSYDEPDQKVSFYSPSEDSWTEPLDVAGATAGDPVYAAGKLVWPGPLSIASSFRGDGIFDTGSGEWTPVDVTDLPGGLAYQLSSLADPTSPAVLGSLVEANGRFLDVTTGEWVAVPDPPVANLWDPVQVAGDSSLLRCFGYRYTDDTYDSGSFQTGCLVLTPTAPAPTTPTVPSQVPSTEPTRAASAWNRAIEFSGPLADPLLVTAKGRYYVIGGIREDGAPSLAGGWYDPATGDSGQIADLPEAGSSAPLSMQGKVVGDLIYVNRLLESSEELLAYGTANDTWHQVRTVAPVELGLYWGTEDGLVSFQPPNLEGELRARMLVAGEWIELPYHPMAASRLARLYFRLDDHHLAVVAEGVMAVLDTASRTWSDVAGPGDGLGEPEYSSWQPLGAEGAAVLINDTVSPYDVLAYANGNWTRPALPETSPRPPRLRYAAAGQRVLLLGHLFDPVTGQWQELPPLPDSTDTWQWGPTVGGPDGVLTCFPSTPEGGSPASTVNACWFYRG